MKAHSNETRRLKRVMHRKHQQRGWVMFVSPVFILVTISLKLPYKMPKKLLQRLRLHIEKLTDNPYFPLTSPSLAELTALAAELDDTITKITAGNKALIPHRKVLEL